MRIGKYLPIILLIFLAIWAGKGLFTYEVSFTQDLKHHLVRSYDAVRTLSEGHFPLRWAGILNYECGVPIFNFYNPLLYYLAAILYYFTGHLILSLKIISFLSLLSGAVFFYLWIQKELGDKWISFASATLYLFAPYTLLLVYVRGSPEYLAYSVVPAIFYFYARAFKEKVKRNIYINLFLASVSGGLLAISHNVVFILLLPIIFVYLFLKLENKHFFLEHFDKRLGRQIGMVILSFISIIGLGAFFIFPAILEKGYTQLDTPIFNFRDHFPTPTQLINSPWEYGNSEMGTKDDHMSFQLGYAQWVVLGLSAIYILLIFAKAYARRVSFLKVLTKNIWLILFFAITLFSLYLILPWSLGFWEKIGILQEIQFSWRILGICVFTTAALSAYLLKSIRNKSLQGFLLIGFVLIAVAGNRNHTLSQPVLENDLPFYRELDQIRSRRRFISAEATTVLPPNVKLSCYFTTPIVFTNRKDERITYKEVERGSTYGSVKFEINKNKLAGDRIIFSLGYYPDMYKLTVNGLQSNYSDCDGLLCLEVNKFADGLNLVSWHVGQTGIQNLFNRVSLVFAAIWGYLILKVKE